MPTQDQDVYDYDDGDENVNHCYYRRKIMQDT